MKVAVITRHAVTNYGSLLQTIATQKVIERLGHSCIIIDYIREDEKYTRQEATLLKFKPEWNNKKIKKFLYKILRTPESIVAGVIFERFRSKFLNLTKRYTSSEHIMDDSPSIDVYVTGSDQVWGPVGNGVYDSTYCLSFTSRNNKRVSYASSFGHSTLTDELKSYYSHWLSKYQHVTVREDSAINMLKGIGITSSQVLDPTLLLSSQEWSEYCTSIPKQRYVLVYQLHNDVNLGRYAKNVANEMGLPLIRVSSTLHQISREGKLVWLPSLGEFLSYIKNAECFITDSFHGTAFAINFNTSFVQILPNNNTTSRSLSILKLTGLQNRILKDVNDFDLAKTKIDYTNANKVISRWREDSIEILKFIIEE